MRDMPVGRERAPRCPDFETLAEHAMRPDGGSLPAEVASHVSTCVDCSALVGELEADEALARELETRTHPPVAAAAPPPAGPSGYQIEREVSRGGQGVVWRALQLATGRTVAVKTLLRGAFAEPLQRARFEREVRLHAALRHPSIVQVFDGGTLTDGTGYLVMEWIDGVRVDEWRDAARPDRRALLALFGEICRGVHHAHQRGVIHRDLKPGNVLVDAQGHPHVLDFGLAKDAGDEAMGGERTATGMFVGTLAYAAPEQLASSGDDADVRTDVYALGGLLYALLAGAPPTAAATGLEQLVRAITEIEPPPPSRADPTIDGDLDRITLRALAKEKERRYQSVGDLLRDLGHYLAGEPLDSRRAERWYVLRKTLRRHRVAAGALVAAFLLLATSTLVSFRFWKESESARAEAERALEQSRRRTARGEEVVRVLRDAFMTPTPYAAGRDATLASFVDRWSATLDSSLPRYPEAEATLRHALGTTRMQLGELMKARGELQKALAAARRAPEILPEEIVGILCAAANVELQLDDGRDAPALISEARARGAGLDPGAPAALMLRLLEAHLAWTRGALDEAESAARAITEDVERNEGRRADMYVKASQLRLFVLAQMRRWGEVETAARELLAMRTEGRVTDHPVAIQVQCILAKALLGLARPEDAWDEVNDALLRARRAFNPGQRQLLEVVYDAAELGYRIGRRPEAVELMLELLEADERRPFHRRDAIRFSARVAAAAAAADGRHDEAEPLLRRALAIDEETHGAAHAETLQTLWHLVETMKALGKDPEAATIVQRILDERRRVATPPDAETVEGFCALAELYADAYDLERAAAVYQDVLATCAGPMVTERLSRVEVMRRLAVVLDEDDRTEEADALRRRIAEDQDG